MSINKKVCIIGGGPAGIMAVSILKDHCDVVCFEQANDIGGQWGANTDDYCKEKYGTRWSSLYKGLWTNSPKECSLEVPNHPWPETDGKITSSFVDGDGYREYLLGYAETFGIRKYTKTSHSVQSVIPGDGKFSVTVHDVEADIKSTDSYDYVIVATGHFNYPNNPTLEGEDKFSGEILHSHDFTDGANYAGKRVLCVGGSYSAEDICMSCKKNGAIFSHVSTRNPAGFGYVDWPMNVLERPGLSNISGSTVTFKDGASEDYDVIIKCTGFMHKFDFLPAELQINTTGDTGRGLTAWVPQGLYKQCISIENPNLFFLGMQNLAYTNTMYQLQSYMIRDIALGKFEIPDKAARIAGFEEDLAGQAAFKNVYCAVSFQTNYMNMLAKLTGEANCDTEHIWVGWLNDKTESIQHFRTKNYASVHTGKKATHVIYDPAMEYI